MELKEIVIAVILLTALLFGAIRAINILKSESFPIDKHIDERLKNLKNKKNGNSL